MSGHIVGVEPTVYNGFKYKSKLEAQTAETLDKLGIPWEYETKTYTLQEGFYCQWQKRKVMEISYTPDFVIGPVMIETKGWKTPDFKLKEKMFYKYLKENEPDAIYYIVRNQKELLEALDRHLVLLGYCVKVTSKSSKKETSTIKMFNSVNEAMVELNISGKPITPILKSLTGKKEWVYNYNWLLQKIVL